VRREARRLGLNWALLEGLAGPYWEDVVGLSEGPSIQVDGRIVVEVNGYLRQLVLLRSRTSHVAVNQELKLFRSPGWGELERSTEKGLGDSEGGIRVGSHSTVYLRVTVE